MNAGGWVEVDGWPDYEVNSTGAVRRKTATHKHPAGFVLTPVLRKGYYVYNLHRNGVKTKKDAHRLVLEHFVGDPPGPVGHGEGEYQANHKNGDKLDNRPENLEWVTCGQNIRHALRMHGKWHARGEKQWRSKLTKDDVREIRKRFSSGSATKGELAEEFGCSTTNIYSIVTRRSWAWLDEPEAGEAHG